MGVAPGLMGVAPGSVGAVPVGAVPGSDGVVPGAPPVGVPVSGACCGGGFGAGVGLEGRRGARGVGTRRGGSVRGCGLGCRRSRLTGDVLTGRDGTRGMIIEPPGATGPEITGLTRGGTGPEITGRTSGGTGPEIAGLTRGGTGPEITGRLRGVWR